MRLIYPCGEAQSNHLVCQIYHQHHEALLFQAKGLCRRYGFDLSVSDDLIQELYLKLLTNREAAQQALGRSGISYLMRMLSNSCIDRFRKGESFVRLKSVLEHKLVSYVDPQDMNVAARVDSLFQQIKCLLSEADFQLMQLYLKGYSYKEIVEELGGKEKTWQVRVYRLRKVLRKHFRRE